MKGRSRSCARHDFARLNPQHLERARRELVSQVRRHHHGRRSRAFENKRAELSRRFEVKFGCGLIERQQQRFAEHRLRENEPSPHAAGETRDAVVDVGVEAKSGMGRTTLNAKNRMVVQVKNQADGSQLLETLTSTGTHQVFWFDPEDAQELLNELYSKNFEKFVADTKLDGKILKLR